MSDHSKFKIAHIISDEKFLTESLPLFLNNEETINVVFLLLDKNPDKIKYIKYIDYTCIHFKQIIPFAKEIEQFNAIIFHSLIEEPKIKLLRYLNHSNILWVGWGHDYYRLWPKDKLYSPATLSALDSCEKQRRGKLYFIRKLKNSILNIFQKDENSLKDLIKKIKFFSPVVNSEFTWVSGWYNSELRYLDWNYYVNQKSLSDKQFSDLNADSILIGNSASPYNNHLDALQILQHSELKINKIYIPLSYGGDQLYISFIKNEFLKSFGHRVIFLDNFLSLEEYNKILSECKVCIFPSYRQMALGNINHCLIKGAQIFLNELNPLYNYLSKEGVKIFSFQNNNNFFKKLTLEEKLNNRKIAERLYSYETLLVKTNELIKELKSI